MLQDAIGDPGRRTRSCPTPVSLMPIDAQPSTVLVISRTSTGLPELAGLLAQAPQPGLPRFTLMDGPLPPAEGLARLVDGGIDVVVVDAGDMPEEALDTLVRLRVEAPDVPVVLVTGSDAGHAAVAAQAIDAGAQDVLPRHQLVDGLVPRVLRYAIERQRLQATLRQLSLTDELTGLYNRRGFFTLGDHHLRLAHRLRGVLLAAIDICGLRTINERYGREAGDRALVSTANVLRATFRASDVVARLGEDDFAVLVLDAAEEAISAVGSRLRARLDQHNAGGEGNTVPLALSMGIARLEPNSPPDVDDLLGRAEEARRWARDSAAP